MVCYSPPLEGRRAHTRLDFNENTVGFPDLFPHTEGSFLTTYPEYSRAVEELAQSLSLKPSQILLTNGSDEGLFVGCFTYIEPNEDRALVGSPTFALIPHYLKLCQADVVEVNVKEGLKPDLAAMESVLQQGVKMAVLATPDNPTGQVLPLDRLKQWLQDFPQTVFLIDEAYNDYHEETALTLIDDFPNLIVSRTFSKAWGLAGLRLGFLAAHPQVVEWMARVRSPYSVNSYAVDALRKLLPQRDQVREQARGLVQRKTRIVSEIRRRGYKVTDGKANFFLIWMGPTAPHFVQFCRDKGLLIRDRSKLFAMTGSVRVSVGSDQEMEKFLEILDGFHQHFALIFDLDDTLVDTSESFDEVVCTLVERKSGKALPRQELQELRASGGFNDDWDATRELLRQRGHDVSYEEIAQEALPLYLELAPKTEALMISENLLPVMKKRHRLFIVTGRTRSEFEPVWKDRLVDHFEEIVCKDDRPELAPKPAPDQIKDLMERHKIGQAIYIGNSVDDMQAAVASGIGAIGVCSNQTEDVLKAAGAETTLESPQELETLWLIDKHE